MVINKISKDFDYNQWLEFGIFKGIFSKETDSNLKLEI